MLWNINYGKKNRMSSENDRNDHIKFQRISKLFIKIKIICLSDSLLYNLKRFLSRIEDEFWGFLSLQKI